MIIQELVSYFQHFSLRWTTVFIIAVLLWIASAVYLCLFHHYADIPGPFWAKVTRLWLATQVLHGNIDKKQRELHRKYGRMDFLLSNTQILDLIHFKGRVVRIAPNEVSISDPEALKTIYAVNAGFTKTDFYTPFAAHISPNEDHFTQRDEKLHAYRRRFVNNLYSLTSILESEEFVDSCTRAFMTRLDGFAASGKKMDLGIWLQMYAFDVVGELFFGCQFGFLENSHDYGNYIQSLDILLPAVATACVLPSYVRPLQILGHLFPPLRRALVCYNNIVVAAKSAVRDRQVLMQQGKVQR
jgi:hypothetical protein